MSEQLSAAIAAREAAAAALRESAARLEKKQRIATHYRGRAEDARLAEQSAAVGEVVRVAQKHRDALTQAAAADRDLVSERASHAQLQRALAEAERGEQQARNQLKRIEADRLAARLVAIRAEELELCSRLLVLDLDSPGTLSATATAALADPPGRPTLESLFAHGVCADVNTPIGGRIDLLDSAREYWTRFDTNLDSAPVPSERAA